MSFPLSDSITPGGAFPVVDGGSQKIINIGDPTSAQDGATKNYVDIHIGGQTLTFSSVSTGQVLQYNGTAWVNAAAPTGFTAGGDLTGTPTSQVVSKWQGVSVVVSSLVSGQVMQYNGTNWANATLPSGFTAGGDLSGSSSSQTVIRFQGRDFSSAAPNTFDVISWNGTAWAPSAPSSVAVFGQDYFFANVVSDISGYDNLATTAIGSEVDLSAAVTSSGGQSLIKAFVTVARSPDVTLIPAGLWKFAIYRYTSLTGAFTTNIVLKIYKRSLGGSEALLFTATSSNIQDTSVTAEVIAYNMASDTVILNTDRIVVKAYAQTTSIASATVHFVFDGTSHASVIETPIVGGSIAVGGDLSGTAANAAVVSVTGTGSTNDFGQTGSSFTFSSTEIVTNNGDSAHKVQYFVSKGTLSDATTWQTIASLTPGNDAGADVEVLVTATGYDGSHHTTGDVQRFVVQFSVTSTSSGVVTVTSFASSASSGNLTLTPFAGNANVGGVALTSITLGARVRMSNSNTTWNLELLGLASKEYRVTATGARVIASYP